jgi:hypothetical protein
MEGNGHEWALLIQRWSDAVDATCGWCWRRFPPVSSPSPESAVEAASTPAASVDGIGGQGSLETKLIAASAAAGTQVKTWAKCLAAPLHADGTTTARAFLYST